jgi:electron transfer flavoprotein alpha subunit
VNASSEILAFSENADVAAEMLAAARELADSSGLRVVSLVLGQDGLARAMDAIAHGADKVLLVSCQSSSLNASNVLVDAMAQAVQAVRPSIVLIGSTCLGAEVAARLAQRLGVASAGECLSLELSETGDLIVERLVYGGRFVTKRVLHSVPRVAAVQVHRFEPLPKDERCGDILDFPLRLPPSPVNVVEMKEPQRSQVDIGKAEVIISVGRGMRSKEDLVLLEPLTRALAGEIAGSRPLVDMQWLPRDRLVGMSGRTVKPRLYVACGISGQIEHIAGMRTSRTVIAINTKPDAPIHKEADYCVVGDLYQIIPALVAALREGQARAAAMRGPSPTSQTDQSRHEPE